VITALAVGAVFVTVFALAVVALRAIGKALADAEREDY
jgi:hypothetical protein